MLALLLLGAMREEIAGLRRRITVQEALAQPNCHLYQGKYGERDILLVQTGVGKERAERATELVLMRFPVTEVISVGFAGALTEESKVGDIILCSALYRGDRQTDGVSNPMLRCYSDTHLISRAAQVLQGKSIRWMQGNSVTVSEPASGPEAKYELGKAFSAKAVDMEGYWIAQIASAKGIPFLAVRAISDAVDDTLPPFDQFMELNETRRWKRTAPIFFLRHPQQIAKLFHLYLNARRAEKSLTSLTDCFIDAVQ